MLHKLGFFCLDNNTAVGGECKSYLQIQKHHSEGKKKATVQEIWQ